MFQIKAVEKIKTHILYSVNFFFFKNRAVYEIMWKKILKNGAGHRWQYCACALHAGYLRLQIHTLRSCNTHCFPTTTVAVTTRLNVTLNVHCLSCCT